ncbi:MAG: hypothetical protein ACC662_04635 [Planctomycetota bacterium]
MRTRMSLAIGLAAVLVLATAANAGGTAPRPIVRTERVYLQLSGMG